MPDTQANVTLDKDHLVKSSFFETWKTWNLQNIINEKKKKQHRSKIALRYSSNALQKSVISILKAK